MLFSLLFSINVFAAGQLTQDDACIHYLKEDGTYAVSAWVEISNLWYFFDANGICINPEGVPAPDDADGCSQIVTSYVPFTTTDIALLEQYLANGTVINVDGQYFMTPDAATVARNTKTISTNSTTAASIVPSSSTETTITTPTTTSTVTAPTTAKTTITTSTTTSTITAPTVNETSGRTVWITKTGEKYHSKNNCGRTNPKTATQISEKEAQSRGYTACKKCF